MLPIMEISGSLNMIGYGLATIGPGIGVALVFAAVVTGVILAGVGMALVVVVACCVVLALALSTPVLLPLLIPVAIVWLLVSRSRKQQARQHSL